jgi:hypothetical protein
MQNPGIATTMARTRIDRMIRPKTKGTRQGKPAGGWIRKNTKLRRSLVLESYQWVFQPLQI